MQRLAFGVVGALAFFSLASPASALPDGPIEPYLEHQEAVTPFLWPAKGSLTDGFGPRWGRLHAGIDVAAPEGTPIRAAESGKVVVAAWTGGYGNYTCIAHGGALSTCYAHMSRFGTSSGAAVRQGQVIGYVGCTGSCTGPHLHFETRVNGSPVDPMGYL